MALLAKDSQEYKKVLSKLIAQAWFDEEFRKRVISHPVAVLEENGLTLPNGVQVRVNENTSLSAMTSTVFSPDGNGVYELPLPPKPFALTDQHIQSSIEADDSDSPIPDTVFCC